MAGTQMQLEDWLDDLCVRFIINLPQEDLSSVARICFQVEEAQWFYEDFIRPLDPTLPSMTLRTFCLRMFQHCPLLASFSVENHTQAFEEFLQYKTRIPVRGAILLNSAMDSTVLVKGWKKGANWSFPRGKINKDEDDLDCAVREVYEETGLDLQAAGLVPKDTKPKYIEISMREQQLRLYVFRDVPMDTPFAPRTRKEISKIEWYKLSELPAFRKKGAADDANNANTNNTNANKFYMVAPFLVPLKKWVLAQKRQDTKRAANAPHAGLHPQLSVDEGVTEEEMYVQPQPMMQQHMSGQSAHALESATQELQRLLKVQPATQGLQSNEVSQSDKGSALLSILQPRSNGAAQASHQYQQQHHQQQQLQQQQYGQALHTPLDHVYTQAPQPRNPHHQTNTRQAPMNPQQMPNFPLGHGQQPANWQYPGQQVGPPQMPPQPHWTGLPQQHQPQPPHTSQPVNLIHPQPLPPQVQRAIFNQSAFQENNQQRGHGAAPPPQQQHQQQHQQFTQQSQRPPQQQQQQQPQQQHQAAPAPGGAPLTGQSMALLNAFKGAPAVASNENARQGQHGHPFPQQQQQVAPAVQPQLGQLAVPAYANQSAAPVPAPAPYHNQPLQQSRPQQQQQPSPGISPKELAGVGVVPQKADHRNALLGMFKSPGSSHVSPASPSAPLQPQHHQQPRQPVPPAHLVPSLSNLSISNKSPRAQVSPSTVPKGPPRILQRGQDPASLNSPGLASLSPSSATTNVRPHPQQQHAPPPTQKSQLLSLFGKQQQNQPSSAGPNSPLAGASSIASGGDDRKATGPSSAAGSNMSRRGSETPISPADQNFLLGYLQSVTNNATASR